MELTSQELSQLSRLILEYCARHRKSDRKGLRAYKHFSRVPKSARVLIDMWLDGQTDLIDQHLKLSFSVRKVS